MSSIGCIAFDCFGTVFDMSTVPKHEVDAYVAHVKNEDFAPYQYPFGWFGLNAHPDAEEGISMLRAMGYHCVTLSNGSHDLLSTVSRRNRITWDCVIDLVKHRAYKPHNLDAYRAVQKETGFKPFETLMVTANPTFGDLESAAAIGMPSQVIRHGHPNTIIELAELLRC